MNLKRSLSNRSAHNRNLLLLGDEKLEGQERFSTVLRLKTVLSGPYDFLPFRFRFEDGYEICSPNPGLEGFLYSMHQAIRERGKIALLVQLKWCLTYARDLLRKSGWDDLLLNSLLEQTLKTAEAPENLLSEFIAALTEMVRRARAALLANDPSQWMKSASIYQIYVRAFNLPGLREALGRKRGRIKGELLAELEPEDLPGAFNSIRWTGVYPIGQIAKKGMGSPFAIADHNRVDSAYGSAGTIKKHMKSLSDRRIKSVFEFSPNHTAIDCWMLEKDPSLYVHTTKKPLDHDGYYEYHHPASGKTWWIRHGGYLYDGKRFYWNDVLQLDISNPTTRRILTDTVKTLISEYGVHGFRVDMAYQLLNDVFALNWGEELQFKHGNSLEEEFFYQLISEVKQEFPHAAFLAEGFYGWEKMSAVGFDLIYSKNEMPLPGGFYHFGWYNAIESKNPVLVEQAIKRAAFLNWQKGGASMLAFAGHHDLPAPQEVFGEWVWGAAFLTLCLPTARNWYASTEVGFKVFCPENNKMINFKEDVRVDWSRANSDFYRFVKETITFASSLHAELGEVEIVAMNFHGPFTGYLLQRLKDPQQAKRVLFLANPSREKVDTHLHRPDLDLPEIHIQLDSCGPKGQAVIVIKP